MGGGTTTQINKTEYPEWVQEAGRRNLAAAYDISSQMPGPYEGQRVATMTPGQISAIGALSNNYAMAQPAYALAQTQAARSGQYQPQQITPGSLAQTDLSPYMNPYTQNVIDRSLQTLETQKQQNLNQAYSDAVRARAFGGSRQGIQEGVVRSAAQKQAADMAANLYSQNFAQAQGAAQSDLARFLQAQQSNQAAGLQGAGIRTTGAQTLGALAGAGQEAFLQGASGAISANAMIQAQQQAEIEAAKQAYTEAQQFPLQQLQIPLQALGATPYGGTQTQTTSGSGGSALASGLGMAATTATLLASIASL
jgi:hypothetical protein